MNRKSKNQGWLLVELTIGITILVLLIVGWTQATSSISRFNKWQLTQQRCNSAALAQLDSLSATGKEIPTTDIKKLWPGVEISTTLTPGQGQWTGLTFAKVTATGLNEDKKIIVTQARYFLGERQAER